MQSTAKVVDKPRTKAAEDIAARVWQRFALFQGHVRRQLVLAHHRTVRP